MAAPETDKARDLGKEYLENEMDALTDAHYNSLSMEWRMEYGVLPPPQTPQQRGCDPE